MPIFDCVSSPSISQPNQFILAPNHTDGRIQDCPSISFRHFHFYGIQLPIPRRMINNKEDSAWEIHVDPWNRNRVSGSQGWDSSINPKPSMLTTHNLPVSSLSDNIHIHEETILSSRGPTPFLSLKERANGKILLFDNLGPKWVGIVNETSTLLSQ